MALMREELLSSTKLFVDETTAPVLDPGRGRTKRGYFWVLARDDRPWQARGAAGGGVQLRAGTARRAGDQPADSGTGAINCLICHFYDTLPPKCEQM